MAATLETQLAEVYTRFHSDPSIPESIRGPIAQAAAEHKAAFDPAGAIQVGQELPSFRLANAVGEEVSSADLLAKGPLLITFYRGEWCPYCNLALAAMQRHLPDFEARGVTLVAVSPELPNQSLSTTEKHALRFPVLSDAGNAFARELGIVWRQPEILRPAFAAAGFDLPARNGDDSFEVPVPATLLVGRDGVVRNTWINPDYSKRVEPSLTLEWIDAL